MAAALTVIVLWFALIAYAVLGGADFGGGVWDFIARGPLAERQRHLISQAIGPVWEANNVWIIFLIVGLYTTFPVVMYTLAVALFVPFILAVLGIVMRGAAFAFRAHIEQSMGLRAAWGRAFSIASIITPICFGASAGAVASGQIHYNNANVEVDAFHIWLAPFPLIIGLLALAICATLAAIYLTVEAQTAKDTDLSDLFRQRALIAGGVTALLGLIGLLLMPTGAPQLWNGVRHQALPLVIITMLVGLATAGFLLLRRYILARVMIVIEVAMLLGTWGIAQRPYLIPPDLTVSGTASPDLTLWEFLGAMAVGMSILLPSLYFLFSVFKGKNPAPRIHGRHLDV